MVRYVLHFWGWTGQVHCCVCFHIFENDQGLRVKQRCDRFGNEFAEIFEEFTKKSPKWLVRASHSETRNGTQASDVVKEGN